MVKNPTAEHNAEPPFLGSEFPEASFVAIRELLLAMRGVDIGMYKDRCIKRRIATRIRALGFDRAEPYVELLRDSEVERERLARALTVHVSQFFRNPGTFAYLERRVLPDLLERSRHPHRKRLRIWSAGCSTGEEAYSVAMLVHDMNPAGVNVSLIGSDVSPAVLEQAKQAVYDPRRLAEVPQAARRKYFEELEGGMLRLREEVRKMVRFRRHDLLADEPYPMVDLIICRNVLIYFSRAEQEKILQRFTASLPQDGVLILGQAESLPGAVREMFSCDSPAERVYRRR